MPRLSTSLIRRARDQHPLLPLLLRPCRDLSSARNELRWLREHVLKTTGGTHLKTTKSPTKLLTWRKRLCQLCLERSRGKPLQYILGSQPFGNLDILCAPGVLIPRSETESIITHLASLLPSYLPTGSNEFHVLDLCTGTGCIPLLMHSLLAPRIHKLQIEGVDISPKALKLAQENMAHNIQSRSLQPLAATQIDFWQDDIMAHVKRGKWKHRTNWDVVVSNPPYISPSAFNKTTSRSVRIYEPKEALVPPSDQTPSTEAGDEFYPRLLSFAQNRTKALLFEVAGMAQATRIAKMVLDSHKWEGCEIWRDWPNQGRSAEYVEIDGKEIRVLGEGNGRAVLAWTEAGAKMLGRKEKSV